MAVRINSIAFERGVELDEVEQLYNERDLWNALV
jgi:hypothetical protein